MKERTLLGRASEVIVGASDIEAMATFFHELGFDAASTSRLDADAARALYGLSAPTQEMLMRADGREHGALRLVATPMRRTMASPYERGAYDISLYCSDIEAAGRAGARAGAHVGPVGVLDLGALILHQRQLIGPDDVRIVLIASETRRSSLLDGNVDRMFSEVHSLVWCVEDIGAAAAFWRDGGLTQTFEMPIMHPAVARFLELPRADVPIRMALLSDEDVSPIRFELLAFPEDRGPTLPTDTLRVGIGPLVFHTEELEAAMGSLRGAHLGETVEIDGARCVAGVAPGGVAFQLRSSK